MEIRLIRESWGKKRKTTKQWKKKKKKEKTHCASKGIFLNPLECAVHFFQKSVSNTKLPIYQNYPFSFGLVLIMHLNVGWVFSELKSSPWTYRKNRRVKMKARERWWALDEMTFKMGRGCLKNGLSKRRRLVLSWNAGGFSVILMIRI